MKTPKFREIVRMGFTFHKKHPNGNYEFLASKHGHPTGAVKIFCITRFQGIVSFFDDSNRYHNEIGPAQISATGYSFYYHGNIHRYNGPARLNRDNNHRYEVWSIHGNTIKPNEYKSWLEEMGMDINLLSDNDKILIDLKWKPT